MFSADALGGELVITGPHVAGLSPAFHRRVTEQGCVTPAPTRHLLAAPSQRDTVVPASLSKGRRRGQSWHTGQGTEVTRKVRVCRRVSDGWGCSRSAPARTLLQGGPLPAATLLTMLPREF